MHWREGNEMHYPQCATDPDYCALKFTFAQGRTYGDFKSGSFAAKAQHRSIEPCDVRPREE
jgi:general stress protein 26